METLAIELTAFGENFVEAQMPVSPIVHQPQGRLHGGATAALAESVGSFGSAYLLRDAGAYPVGIELNASHVGSATDGTVTARGELVHKGRSLHVWEIKIRDESGKLISTCRLTNMIIKK